jgi:hypothetical protein
MMALQRVSTTTLKDGRSITVEYDFGSSLEEAIELFGEEVVFSNAKANMVIGLQGRIRALMKKNKEGDVRSEEEIIALASAWKPGIKVVKESDPVGAITKRSEKMSLSQIEDTIEALRKKMEEMKVE